MFISYFVLARLTERMVLLNPNEFGFVLMIMNLACLLAIFCVSQDN